MKYFLKKVSTNGQRPKENESALSILVSYDLNNIAPTDIDMRLLKQSICLHVLLI